MPIRGLRLINGGMLVDEDGRILDSNGITAIDTETLEWLREHAAILRKMYHKDETEVLESSESLDDFISEFTVKKS